MPAAWSGNIDFGSSAQNTRAETAPAVDFLRHWKTASGMSVPISRIPAIPWATNSPSQLSLVATRSFRLVTIREVGKKVAGYLLDGQEWKQLPIIATPK
jgi:hypothetical protein